MALSAVAAALSLSPPRRVLRRARRYVGIREVQTNAGFSDARFQEMMRSAGWYSSAQWCAFFVRMVLLSLCRPGSEGYKFWNGRISANTNVTWDNLQRPDSRFFEISDTPLPGSIAIYGGIVPDYRVGHIEFVDRVFRDGSYSVVSGNDTFPDGTQGVVASRRKATGPNASKYKILGFIKIKRLS